MSYYSFAVEVGGKHSYLLDCETYVQYTTLREL